MSQQKQAPETAETYRKFIKQLIDEIQDPNALWRIYSIVLFHWKKGGSMTETEIEIINMIRDSKDPAKAMCFALDALTRLVAGESPDSVMASYGISLEDIKV